MRASLRLTYRASHVHWCVTTMPQESDSPWTLPSLDAYFESGLIPRAGDPNSVVLLGYAIFRKSATDWRNSLTAACLTCRPGYAAEGLWGLSHPRLGPQERAGFDKSKAAGGLQFYDLVAARALGVNLRDNEFTGEVEVFSDGEQVIRFLSGDLRALTLHVGDIEFARELRTEVLEGFGPRIKVTWTFVRSERNLADPAIKALHQVNVRQSSSITPGPAR